jgi:hypothetical protein
MDSSGVLFYIVLLPDLSVDFQGAFVYTLHARQCASCMTFFSYGVGAAGEAVTLYRVLQGST